MKVIDKSQLFTHMQELKKFLDSNPALKPFQKEIDEALRKAGENPENRMQVLRDLMIAHIEKLKKSIDLLSK